MLCVDGFLSDPKFHLLSPQHLMNRVSGFMHVYTLYSAVRPFGCSLIMGSYGPEGPTLYMADPSGVSWVSDARVATVRCTLHWLIVCSAVLYETVVVTNMYCCSLKQN